MARNISKYDFLYNSFCEKLYCSGLGQNNKKVPLSEKRPNWFEEELRKQNEIDAVWGSCWAWASGSCTCPPWRWYNYTLTSTKCPSYCVELYFNCVVGKGAQLKPQISLIVLWQYFLKTLKYIKRWDQTVINIKKNHLLSLQEARDGDGAGHLRLRSWTGRSNINGKTRIS